MVHSFLGTYESRDKWCYAEIDMTGAKRRNLWEHTPRKFTSCLFVVESIFFLHCMSIHQYYSVSQKTVYIHVNQKVLR